MFVPGISKRSSSSTSNLERRKGGGGGGRGGGGGGGRGSSGGGKSSGSSSGGKSSGSGGTPRTSSSGLKFGGGAKSSSSYSRGGGAPSVIGAGLPFAGRSAGGGTRGQIYGSRSYGSGYGSGFAGRGVAGRSFPFFFWPIVFGGGALLATDIYLDARHEYGDVNNSTRPGGALATTTFQSLSSTSSTFRVVADNDTVTSLIIDLSQNCSSNFVATPAPTSTPISPSASIPRPEQVIQYYRASSVALTLDGYNNTATYAPDGTPDSPLPSDVDMALLTCLNQTIGAAVPLVNGASGLWTPPSHVNLIGLVCALWFLMKSN